MSRSTDRSITVLVAEDDADDRLITREAWDEADLDNDLRFVEDGEELLDYLFRRGRYAAVDAAPRPGLILLDLNMPKVDGRDALREIREHETLRCVPVVVLTTSGAAEDVAWAYDTGANSYMRKPSTYSGLSETVKAIGRYWLEHAELPIDGCDGGAGSESDKRSSR
ncbi:MAG: response regulator [Leptolyngbya sp. PLA2]|nr:response regulator [Leptolyngbya sp.]MCE7972345.1 response regulator [Leptolyngbya sp. PL-A2]MCZ7632484.1 response regulator [Phycisphaerales bacterium]MDL1905060.1 response regulator [Synechococcales cyanobacterium CNB]GIK19960.1 MAG: response regulator [Planctomycetota bacterium]